jgi:hypothetical protein
MRLQVKGAGVRRRRDKTIGLRVLGIAHVNDGETVRKHVTDIGMALVHHDLHAVAMAVELVIADEVDVTG